MKILTAKRERFLVAEMERLRTENRLLRNPESEEVLGQITALQGHVSQLRVVKDLAYLERNRCVALIATLAQERGWPVGRARTAIEGWSADWHNCVYIDLPAGQVSWHYHDSHAHLFVHLPLYGGRWDGHTVEEKYHRVQEQTVAHVFP